MAHPSLSNKHLVTIDRESPEIEMEVKEMTGAESNR